MTAPDRPADNLLWGDPNVDELVAILAHHNAVPSEAIRSVAVLLHNYGVRSVPPVPTEALRKYGDHLPDCESLAPYKDRVSGVGTFNPPCSCGFEEALRGPDPTEEPTDEQVIVALMGGLTDAGWDCNDVVALTYKEVEKVGARTAKCLRAALRVRPSGETPPKNHRDAAIRLGALNEVKARWFKETGAGFAAYISYECEKAAAALTAALRGGPTPEGP